MACRRVVCLLIAAALPITSGCHKTTGSVTNPNSPSNPNTVTVITPPAATTYTAHVLVRDVNGHALSQATVDISGNSYAADSNGTVVINDLSTTGSQLGMVASPNYITVPVWLSSAMGDNLRTVALQLPQVTTQFAANSPATVDLHAHAIVLSPNSFADPNGTPYTGTVHIAASSFDPTTEVFQSYSGGTAYSLRDDFDLDTIPSGALTVVAGGQVMHGPPEGYVNLSATDDAGAPLVLAPGAPAVVHIALTPFTQRQPGDVLPLMSYDPNQALWVQDGNCTVQAIDAARNMPGRLECVGTVQHFSATGVPSAGVTPGYTCVTYQASVTKTMVSNFHMSIEASQGSSFVYATDQATMRDGSQCYLGELPTTRLVGTGVTSTGTQVWVSQSTTAQSSAMTLNDVAQFRAGNIDHACYKCPRVTVAFNTPAGPVSSDGDHDGYPITGYDGAPSDCNDTNPLFHPGAVDTVCDTADKNCDGITPPGSVTMGNANSAAEWNTVLCKLACAQKTPEVSGNAYDEDCDGIVSDADNDSYFNVADPTFITLHAIDGNVIADCDDQNPNVHPGNREIAGNLVDEDCDGYIVDADNDAFISPAQSSVSVANVYGLAPIGDANLRYRDCDDWDTTINPNAANLARESVFAAYYVAGVRQSALCNYIDPNGALNLQGRTLLVDVNCDGLYSDLDGDGYTVAGDTSLGVGKDIDCDDLDPRLTTQVPCVLTAATAALDGGTCTPKLQGSRNCTSGYVWSPPVNNCIDINECANGTATCDANQICVNTQGAYICLTLESSLVAGDMTLSVSVPETIHVSFQPATGVAGPLTYTLYDVAGTFSAATVQAVQNEGTVATTVNNANDVDIPGLLGNTNYQVAIVVQDSNNDATLYAPQSIVTLAPPSQIAFLVSSPNGGNLGGIVGGDALCNANNPTGVATSKALLVDGTTRVGCTSINCQNGGGSEHVDWVLNPNTQILRTDGTLITTTDPNGLFTFPLTNAIAASPTHYEWFSGMSPNWVRNYNNCNNWTDNTSAYTVEPGDLTALPANCLDNEMYFPTCDASLGWSLVCVQQ